MKPDVVLVVGLCLLLVCTVEVHGKRQGNRRGRGPKFNFVDCGGSRACLGDAKLNSLVKDAGLQEVRTADDIAKLLDEDHDLGVDLVNNKLIYACSGFLKPPAVPQAAASATAVSVAFEAAQAGPLDTAAAVTDATTSADSIVAAADVPLVAATAPESSAEAEVAAGHRRLSHAAHDHSHDHRHHHHHRRSLLQRATAPAPAPVVMLSEIPSGIMPTTVDASIPGGITQTTAFTLHSRPGATRKILLDFDGHITTGTYWNTMYNRATITTPAYDKDNNPKFFSQEELSDIVAIWRAVAEDYSPFDVDVTTEDPGAAAMATAGVRVAIGGSGADWWGQVAGGAAYNGLFGQDVPAFVFAADLYHYPKYVWESVSHEVGHTLGLSHDLQADQSYSTGTPTWAPIMGSAYYGAVTQFSKGEYAGALNTEDDFGIMSNFLPYVPQQQGSTTATATDLPVTAVGTTTQRTGTVSGIISKPTDVDMYKFAVPTTSPYSKGVLITVTARTLSPWGPKPEARTNLPVQVTLRQGSTVRLSFGGYNPSGTTSKVTGGTYFVSVAPSGQGSEFGTYGSRGQYQLTVTYQPA